MPTPIQRVLDQMAKGASELSARLDEAAAVAQRQARELLVQESRIARLEERLQQAEHWAHAAAVRADKAHDKLRDHEKRLPVVQPSNWGQVPSKRDCGLGRTK